MSHDKQLREWDYILGSHRRISSHFIETGVPKSARWAVMGTTIISAPTAEAYRAQLEGDANAANISLDGVSSVSSKIC
ncbi:hypothetical protein [Microvirga puerhi]|uniref:Uncharacterized protein n=1 Tax=Microvirga puerhi TaxID=2876078 RepID=A0ABS7VUD1_9HYPH|nr:hypothetical protein [Microvirga puerhi]MBZ6079204.1 hypothetical protein [Microvirga puerhi]